MPSGDTIGLGRPCKVCVDPGHGGHDPGGKGCGLVEKDLNLAVSQKLIPLLRDNGHTVVPTRQTDEFVSLSARAHTSVDRGCELFVSIHCDDSDVNPNLRGCSAFCRKWTYTNGLHLARSLAVAVHEGLGVPHMRYSAFDGGVAGPHWLDLGVFRLASNARKVTAALVECLFVSNTADAAIARRPDFADRASLAIAQGIHRHLGLPGPAGGSPTMGVKIVRHSDGVVLAEVDVVPEGDHVADQRKLYVSDTGIMVGS